VTVSPGASTWDFEALLKAVLIGVQEGTRDIVLSGPGLERPSTAATPFVRLLLRHGRDLGVSVSLDPPQDLSTT
jgi:hypothetical protein